MSCSISGEVPTEPVVCTKTGHVFEKSLIEKHINQTGTCPMNKESMSLDDLIPLKSNAAVKPRPPSATSIPSMLKLFQDEWDATALETFTLKQHVHTLRQQLAHALYQHDAACRVIARLIKERDEARNALGDTAALAKTQASSASAMEVEQEEEVEGAGISASVIATMESTAKKCSKGRRKRCKALAAVVNAQPLSSYTVGSSNNLHKASAPGVTSLALKDDLILSGGVDATAIIYNKETGKIQDTLKQHKKKVTDVAFHPTSDLSTCITTSADNSAVVWSKNSASAKKLSAQYTFTHHSDEVVGCTLHPSNQYLVTASKDKTWAFYDITSGVLKEQVAESKIESAYSRVCFHPDGLILGCGTEDAMIRIFDIKKPTNQKIAATLEGHKGKITGLSFSENGYYLASGDDNGVVKVWDLRYLSEVKTLTNTKVSTIGNVCFDTSGALLGVGGNDGVTTFYNSKTWDVVSEYKEHTDVVTDLVYERELNYFVSSSLDRSIKIWTA